MRRIIYVAGMMGCVALSAIPRSAHASVTVAVDNFVVTFVQDGLNVVATGSGAIDLIGLTYSYTTPIATGVSPASGAIAIGPAAGGSVDVYTGFTGPSSFGSGGPTIASSGSGDEVAIYAYVGELGVPAGYTSGSLSDTMTFDNATFASLGLTPAKYVYSWGEVADPTFTIQVAATPLPAALPLFAGGLGAMGLLGWRRKRKAQATA
jgi:hypothetical protein